MLAIIRLYTKKAQTLQKQNKHFQNYGTGMLITDIATDAEANNLLQHSYALM